MLKKKLKEEQPPNLNQVASGDAGLEMSGLEAFNNLKDQPLSRENSAKKEQEAGSKIVK